MGDKKVIADLEIKCPKCEAPLKVRYSRECVNEPVKAEYEFDVDVEINEQGKLFDDGGTEGAEVS